MELLKKKKKETIPCHAIMPLLSSFCFQFKTLALARHSLTFVKIHTKWYLAHAGQKSENKTKARKIPGGV